MKNTLPYSNSLESTINSLSSLLFSSQTLLLFFSAALIILLSLTGVGIVNDSSLVVTAILFLLGTCAFLMIPNYAITQILKTKVTEYVNYNFAEKTKYSQVQYAHSYNDTKTKTVKKNSTHKCR